MLGFQDCWVLGGSRQSALFPGSIVATQERGAGDTVGHRERDAGRDGPGVVVVL